LAVPSAVRFSFTGPRRPQLSDQCTLSSSLAFRQSLAQPDLAGRSQSVSASQGLSVPSAHEGAEVYLPRDLPDPATFRPQGLATLSADYSLRARAGLFSYRQRSWDFALRSFLLAEGIRRVSAGMNPPTVFPVGSPALLRWAGPTGRGSWAFTLPGVPGTGRRISAASTGCSLGLHPHRACGSKRRTGFRPCLLPRAFGDQLHSGSTAPRSLKRLRPRFIRHPENREPHKATLSGFWHRIIRERLNESRPGYGFTLRRVVHHCRPPALLGRSPRSTGAAQVRSGVPSISRDPFSPPFHPFLRLSCGVLDFFQPLGRSISILP
jgi:hypothetical protein